jgi:hypothetical protein
MYAQDVGRDDLYNNRIFADVQRQCVAVYRSALQISDAGWWVLQRLLRARGMGSYKNQKRADDQQYYCSPSESTPQSATVRSGGYSETRHTSAYLSIAATAREVLAARHSHALSLGKWTRVASKKRKKNRSVVSHPAFDRNGGVH